MNWLLLFLEEVIPFGSVVLSLASAAVAFFAYRKTSREISEVREKVDRVRNSPVVEDHAELPGFSDQAEVDDMDERP